MDGRMDTAHINGKADRQEDKIMGRWMEGWTGGRTNGTGGEADERGRRENKWIGRQTLRMRRWQKWINGRMDG